MQQKILIATGNKHKRDKLRWIVEGLFDKVEFPEGLGINIQVKEAENTFEANAAIKAREYSRYYQGYTIATDGGITIPSLGQNWNAIFTKRFAGDNATDFERIEKLLSIMKGKKGKDREAVWREAVAVAKDGKVVFSKEVTGANGIIEEKFDKSKYREGIWVCSIWFFPQFNKNFFDLDEEETKKVENSWFKLRKATRKFFLSSQIPLS